MKRALVFAVIFRLFVSTSATAAQNATIIYQNDLHGWLFPSSSRVGMVEMSEILMSLFEKNPNAFYAVSGDLFTGPDFIPQMKGVLELRMWNHFWEHLANNGFGDRVLISPGNHDFDYGVPAPDAFSSGLLCANLLNAENQPYYVPYRVVESSSGLRVDFRVFLGEPRVLHEGDFKVLNPFGDHLVAGEVTGRQIREILEGDAIRFHNQVSGIRYKVDRKRPIGKRVSDIEIDGRPLQFDRRYSLTHNAYCARPENMKMYLHLKPGSVDWKRTSFLCHEVLADYAKHLKTIDYSSDGDGWIAVTP